MAEVVESPGLPPELAALQAEAAALEIEHAPPAVDETGAIAEPVNYQKDVRALVDILADASGTFWPSTKKVLPPEKRQMLAEGWAPVAEQYQFSLVACLGKYGVWIGAGFATSQVAIPFAEAIRTDREAAQRAAIAAAPPPPVAGPSAATTAAPPSSDLYSRA